MTSDKNQPAGDVKVRNATSGNGAETADVVSESNPGEAAAPAEVSEPDVAAEVRSRAENAAADSEAAGATPPLSNLDEPDPLSRSRSSSKVYPVVGRWLSKTSYGTPVFIILAAAAFVAVAYACWWLLLGKVVDWANEEGEVWRWMLAWIPVLLLAYLPFIVVAVAGPISLEAMNATGERAEKRELDELDMVEAEIRGSGDPVDYARYSRKALRAYYLMGQNQVKLSFYVGVAAMVFGFVFLVAGLILQALDTTNIPYLRKDQDMTLITVGGGVIIEFIAATFLWIYKTAIVQLNHYYRRQTIMHSALLSVAVAKNLQGDDRSSALKDIISIVVTPSEEKKLPELPKFNALRDKEK